MRMRIAYLPIRMPITYPHQDNLSASGQPIRIGPDLFLARSAHRQGGFCAMRSPLEAFRRRVGALDGVIPQATLHKL